MRTRNRKLIHYGITEARGRELLQLATQEDYRDLVCQAAELSNSYLASYLVKSLRQGIGYDRIFGRRYIYPCTRADFYGYRRKTLAIIDRLLAEKGGLPDGQLP